MQPFLHHRFLTEKIQGLLFLQSSPIDIADSCNTLLSGYGTFWSSEPGFILDTADLLRSHFMMRARQKIGSQSNTMFSVLQIFVPSPLLSTRSTLLQFIDGAFFSISHSWYLWSKLWELEYKIYNAAVSSECLTYVCKLQFVSSKSSLSQWMWD